MRSTLDRLANLADAHGGYFTTAEAVEAGLSRRLLSHHATTGTLERVDHGIYRLRLYPAPRFEDLIVTALWAGSEAAISHESALVVYGLGEAMPPVVHVTVPRPFRGRRPSVVVHRRPLGDGERVVVDAVPVTSVERTLADVAESSDPALVRAAVGEALDRGQTTLRRIERAVSDPAARDLLLGTRDLRNSATSNAIASNIANLDQLWHCQGDGTTTARSYGGGGLAWPARRRWSTSFRSLTRMRSSWRPRPSPS